MLTGADGLVFAVHDGADGAFALGSFGAGMGYVGSVSNGFAVDFDTWANGGSEPQPVGEQGVLDHVGYNEAGTLDTLQWQLTAPIELNEAGGSRFAWIDHDGASDTLDVFLSEIPEKPAAPLLVQTAVDLPSLVGSQAFFGFTAGTGGANQGHDILDFGLCLEGVTTDFQLGSRLEGSITAADTDVFTFLAVEGTLISMTARTGKGSGLAPTFSILSPSGELLSGADPSNPKIKNLEVPTTGVHRVEISGASGSTGDYQIRTKAKFPTKVQETVEVGVAGAVISIPGIPGMTVKKLNVKALKPKGDFATVGGMPANLELDGVELQACGSPIGLGDLKVNGPGTSVKARNVGIDALGSHALHVAGVGGSVGFAKVKAKLAFAKGKGTVVEP